MDWIVRLGLGMKCTQVIDLMKMRCCHFFFSLMPYKGGSFPKTFCFSIPCSSETVGSRGPDKNTHAGKMA